MRRKVIIIVALAVTAGTAFAYLGQVVASWRSPAINPLGAAQANGTTLFWVYCRTSGDNVYRVNANTGSVISSFRSPATSDSKGLAYTSGGVPGGNYLWIGDSGDDTINMCDFGTGRVYLSWKAGHDPMGLAPEATGDGGANPRSIISTDTSPTYTWLHHPITGSIISSFFHGGSFCVDIAYDWRNKLIWGGIGNPGILRGWNTSGTVVASFLIPDRNPYALSYWNQYLWIGTTSPNHYFYKVHCPFPVDITPASIGKVKALFK